MSQYLDTVIFIDRHEAKVFRISPQDEAKLLFTHTSAQRQHHRADREDSTKHAVDDTFMKDIVNSLSVTGNILICGPGNSKYELEAYIQQRAPKLAERVSGVEPLDDPKDSHIVGIGRQFFQKRGERHRIEPVADSRAFDVPAKS
jgi:stalled ribosome rescue protein Dom34